MRRSFLLQAASAALATLPLGALAAAEPALTFGVVPQQSASALARTWIPLFNVISARAGIGLRFATAPDIPAFEKRLAAGAYDVAYMNPYHYTVFSQKPGYRAFAVEKDRRLRGLVVVRNDGPMRQLADLASQEVAFPAPAAFAATVLVRAELKRQSIPIKAQFVGSHESVYLNVARGLYPAGGGIPRTLQAMDAEVRKDLRVLWQTQAYTPHALAAHPRVPAAQVDALLRAMLAIDTDPAGRAALQGIGFTALAPAQDADWADVRALGIDTLAALLKG